MNGNTTPFSEHCKHEIIPGRGIHQTMYFQCNARMEDDEIRRRRLQEYLDDKLDGVQVELGRRIDRSASQVSDMLAGRKSFGARIAREIEKLLKLQRNYLDTPYDDDESAPLVAREDRPRTPISPDEIPLISWVAAGHWSEAFDPYAPGAAESWISVPGYRKSGALALRVRGDSMEPKFPDGSIIIAEPNRKPKSGDFVVVRNNDWNEATFKQLVQDGAVGLLKPLNTRYPVQQLTPGTVLVGVVVHKFIDEPV